MDCSAINMIDLELLTNPMELQKLNKKKNLFKLDSNDLSFYKKRIFQAAKDILLRKPIDIKVYSVQTEFDRKKWKKFIINQGIGNWINVGDILQDEEENPAASSNWRDQYDIYSTPVIYLLDKDKKILAKRISYKQISKIIKRLEEK